MRDVRPWARRALRPAVRVAVPALQKARTSVLPERDRRANEWVAAGFDRSLRQEYPLGRESLVFDLGGYEGQWASDIFARYLCAVWVFEPVSSFAEAITRRFEGNPEVRLFPFGLAASTRKEQITVADDRSSTFVEGTGPSETIELVQAAEFLRTNDVDHIDLMKVNIEGGEYELLEHLIAEGFVERISDMQIQFHDFVPDAPARMQRIQAELERTHTPTYSVPFVWENWRRR